MRSLIVRGFAWKAGSQVVLQASRVALGIILARLLTPHEYGLAGMVIIFSALVLIFTDIAFGSALVRRREITDVDTDTVFWATVGLGALFTVLGIALARPLSSFYGEPAVAPLFAVLSCSFVITALGSAHRTLLTRAMNFRSLELRQIVATFLGGITAVTVAYFGAGAWAIIVQQMVIAFVSTFMLWLLLPWRPHFKFSWVSFRELGAFGSNVLGTHVFWYINRNVDTVLIGRFLGSAALGAYTLSYNIMLFPLSRIASPLREVLFPAFSKIQDDRARIGAMWLRVNRAVAAIAMPGMIGLIIVAPEFVDVVLGNQWRTATPVIQILAWVGLLQALQQLNASVLQACDKTHLLLRFALITLVASVVAFVLGVRWGIVGVATAYAAVNTVTQPFYTWLTARTLGVKLSACLKSYAGVAQATALMAAAVLAARYGLTRAGVPEPAMLALLVTLGAATYTAGARWRAPELLGEFKAIRGPRPDPQAP